MRAHGSLQKDEEVNAAAKHGFRGAAVGAARWGLPFIFLSGVGQVMSPVYRGLTIQFKIFIIMSGMVIGGMIEGDRRVVEYERNLRVQKIRRRREMEEAQWMRERDD